MWHQQRAFAHAAACSSSLPLWDILTRGALPAVSPLTLMPTPDLCQSFRPHSRLFGSLACTACCLASIIANPPSREEWLSPEILHAEPLLSGSQNAVNPSPGREG